MRKRQKSIILFFLMFTIYVQYKDKKEPTLPTTPVPQAEWSVSQKGNILEIAYGSEGNYPQYAAFHLNDSYFRLIYGPESTWGTSVILMPSFWERGKLYQGAAVSHSYQVTGSDLMIFIEGDISSLNVNAQIQISPPADNSITAQITVSLSGDINLDDRPGEAFKLVTFSSMHISPNTWDCCYAFADSSLFSIPTEGWIINPPLLGSMFGLEGGTSTWKNNAPTMGVQMDRNVSITGWVTSSTNPSNDNVGFWGAADHFVRFWSYKLISRSGGRK
jgi:hypothetical protein